MTTTPATPAKTLSVLAAPQIDVPYAIELVGIGKHYGTVTALVDVSLEIEPGEFIVLLGPSGCGKSTILKIIAGLEDATEGEVYINGRLSNYVRPGERDVSMVFQNYALYPHMTVESNIGFPLKMRGSKKDEVRRLVGEVAELLELGDQLKKLPEQLSGGQRQRVALGRAIIRRPVAFLMDEPLSNLDALLRVQMRSELLKLHRRVGRTTVYVTHDQVEAMTMADRIVVMRSGAVQQVGSTAEIYARPANTFVATFVGSPQMNLIPGLIEGDSGERYFRGAISVPLGPAWQRVPTGTRVTLGIRPENMEIGDAGNESLTAGVVDLVEDVGAEDFISVNLGDKIVVVRTNAHALVREGDRVGVRPSAAAIHLFDQDGIRIDGQPAV